MYVTFSHSLSLSLAHFSLSIIQNCAALWQHHLFFHLENSIKWTNQIQAHTDETRKIKRKWLICVKKPSVMSRWSLNQKPFHTGVGINELRKLEWLMATFVFPLSFRALKWIINDQIWQKTNKQSTPRK